MLRIIRRATHLRSALIGGGFVFMLTLLGAVLIGNVYSDTLARGLIEAMAPSIHTLGFAVIATSATVIALMPTFITFAQGLHNNFNAYFYAQVRLIALMCCVALITSVIMLLILTIPLTETDTLSIWFSIVYYFLILCVAVTSAMVVGVIIMLYKTLTDLLNIALPPRSGDTQEIEKVKQLERVPDLPIEEQERL
ncbi:MAG: hypothetical protein OHK0046_34830 [Anaerolineae bacterium]